MIVVSGLEYRYRDATGRSLAALRGVDFRLAEGECVGLLGATGSGKTTLAMHLNGILRPERGRVVVDEEDLWAPRPRRVRAELLRHVRRNVGVAFQYPEHQLFEETVRDDVAFGLRNAGVPEEEVAGRVEQALAAVGLDAEIAARSPFALSGGQMRRVALAGILVMEPHYLVLDEPTAGLDPGGSDALLGQLGVLARRGIALLLVTHEMEAALRLCHRLVVLSEGRVVASGTPREIFGLGASALAAWGLEPPTVTRILAALQARGLPVRADALTVEEAHDVILEALRSA